jgi:SAM-dependent methyltransferase
MKYRVAEQNRALARLIGRPRTVLDVGCGVGLNGEAARKKGARVTGIELDAASAEDARTRLHEVFEIDITDERALERALDGRRFDLMLFGDVLEHFAAPRATLERLLTYLEDGGHAIVSLPNVAAWTMRLGLLAGRFDYQPSGILDETHLRFFTLASALRLFEDAGLEVLRIDQNPMLVRAMKPWIEGLMLESGDAPTALGESLGYRLYQLLVRPIEDAVVDRRPELLAFQHVFLVRKPPRRGPLSLTVGMLTMDEEQSVARMIGDIRRIVPDARILCVDSSMRDRTPAIARELGARVLRQVPPRGHGPAMEQLLYSAAEESELLIYLDCDFTYPPSYIPVLRSLCEEEGFDVVNCARTREKADAMPWPNFVANRTFAAMAHAMHGVPTVDVHSGMRAYRSSVIRAFDFDGEGDAHPIDTLLFPAKCGYRVAEMPISYDEREGVSKLRKLAGTVWTVVRLARAVSVGRRGAPHYTVR